MVEMQTLMKHWYVIQVMYLRIASQSSCKRQSFQTSKILPVSIQLLTNADLVFNLVLDWVKWSTWDSLWARIWSKTIQKIGDLSTNFMYHIFHLRHHSIRRLVLHWTHTDLTSPTEFHCKDIRSLYKVSYPRIICIWLPSKHAEVSSDTICCLAPGFILRVTFGH